MLLKRRSEQTEALRKVGLFQNLSKKQLDAVARQTRQAEHPAGTVLMRQGRLGKEFVLIIDGTARVERDGQAVNRVGPGSFFGEISLLDGKPRTATVVAETPCSLLVVERQAFGSLLDTVPGLQRQVMLNLCARLREAYAESSH
jgi:CRP/FNR family cyclic AMP-dependent transcriptional regulator